jgi:5-methylcytosine-specific restriction endonuclease McrA
LSFTQFTKGEQMNRICFICETPLTSARSQIYKKTITCSTDCGVILREINIRGKVFACEIQSFIDWSVGYKTDIQSFIDWSVGLKTNIKVVDCKDCGKSLGLRKLKSTMRFCNDCANVRNKKSSKQNHKVKMLTDEKYRLKTNAEAAKQRHKRRTLQSNGELIDLYELAERDQWQCKLCNEPISKDAKHYKGNLHLQGPSLDHIIPVSLGGTHTWDNVQLAHFYCNSIRGNKPLATA